MSAAPDNSAAAPSLVDLQTTVDLYTHMAAMRTTTKTSKKNAPRSYATRVANKTPEGELRRGTTTYRTNNARMAAMHLFNSADRSQMGGDLMIITLKYLGSNKTRLKLAPNDETVGAHLEYFDQALSEENGEPAQFMWFKDFNELGAGCHIHMLISRSVKPETIHGLWAITTGQDYEDLFDDATNTGYVSWTPNEIESYYGVDADETFKFFCRYEGYKFNVETGEIEKKIAQKRVDAEWIRTGNFRVQWAGLSKALTPATPLRVSFTCTCGNEAVRAVMQAQTPAPRNIVEFDCRENIGEKVSLDLGRWSFDALGKGATEYCDITDEMRAAVRAIEAEHAGCTGPAPVAAEEVSPVPTTTTDVSTPAESITTATAVVTKGSPMTDINKALEGMFPAAVAEEMEQSAKEAFIASFPPITIAERHAELAAILADPTVLDSAKERASVETARLIERAIDGLTTPALVDEVAREARINARAEVIAPRLEKLVAHAATVDLEHRKAFADLPLLEQVESLLAPVAPVEIPRMSSDTHARRPRFVAGLTSRTDADLAYLAALVRIERSVDAMMADAITPEEHLVTYARDVALIDDLLESGDMTPLPLEWVTARRANAL
jgi:hypothetical protein